MLVVLESIDGGGKGKQRKEVANALRAKYPEVEIEDLEWPDKVIENSIYNDLLHHWLHKEIELNADSVFLAFLLEKVRRREQLQKAKGSKTYHLICDGYYTTTLTYQCILEKAIELDRALALAKEFRVPEADLNILLDVDVDVAQGRKQGEKGDDDEGLDRNEGDLAKQKIIKSGFKTMANKNIFGEWAIVDGNGTVEEVTNLILSQLDNLMF